MMLKPGVLTGDASAKAKHAFENKNAMRRIRGIKSLCHVPHDLAFKAQICGLTRIFGYRLKRLKHA
jgi:hypothetical protein